MSNLAAIAAAGRKLLLAREARHAKPGELPPPHEAPDPVKHAEREFLAAREAFFRDQAGR